MELRIRTLIVDDEHLARRRIASLLKTDPDIEVVGSAASAEDGLRIMEAQEVDLVFLDIQMPRTNGFEFLRAIPQEPAPAVIFVTAFDEHAVRAFDEQAVDYLLKPYDDERFRKALRRAKKQIAKRVTPKAKSRIAVRVGEKWLFIKSEDIDWIEAEGKYTRLHVAGSTYLRREGLAQMESELDAATFVRIHRSTVVNIDRIREIRALFHGDYEAVLHDGTKLTVSRRYRAKLQSLVGSF